VYRGTCGECCNLPAAQSVGLAVVVSCGLSYLASVILVWTLSATSALHCVQKKNIHSCFLLYLHGKCFDFHKVFKGIVCITPVEKVDIFCYWWRHADVIFLCRFVSCRFYHWRQAFDEIVKAYQLVIVLTELKNMLMRHAIFHCELFSCYIFGLNARSSTLLMLASLCALHHFMDDHLPAISRTAWYCQSC